MKEKHFCRCCLSEECYKDMANTYYIGNKTENYLEMLLNIFNINIINNDAQRCLICEECVSNLRNAATFKKSILEVQDNIKNNLCWENNSTGIDTKIEGEESDYFDDFEDDISDNDFKWDNFTQDNSQKGQIFYITVESNGKKHYKPKTISKLKKTISCEKEDERDEGTNRKFCMFAARENVKVKNAITLGANEKNKVNNPSTLNAREKDTGLNLSALGTKDEDILDQIANNSDFDTLDTTVDTSNGMNTEPLDSEKEIKIDINSEDIIKRTAAKRTVTTEPGTANRHKDINKTIRREYSEEQLVIKRKSEDTMKLVQNSNLCLFRSLRNKFGCNFCKMKFPEFSQLKEHSFTHKNPRLSDLRRLRGLSCKNADISDLKCTLCSEKCTNLEYLRDHLKKEHEMTFHGTEYYLVPYKLQDGNQCVICELKFNTYMRLSVHMNSHYTNNVCESCGLSFINRSGLRTHVQAQHKEKQCSRCPAIFVTNSSKIKHLKLAHGVRPSKRSICNICNKTFKYTYILDEHKILEHGFKRPAVSTCEVCGKTFLTALKLKTHVRSVHIKERKYPCTKCDMRFFTTCDRRRHERTHEDVRSFSCSYCDAKFKSKDSWRRHLKRQHGHVFVTAVT